jgi:predicted negative regulator of RcsB-dependent stress response
MSDLRTDEEQVEALKRWWDENGKQLVAAILLAAGGWLGWDTYQKQQQTTGENAQLQYQQLLQLRQAGENSEEQLAKAQLAASDIKKNFEGTPYAIYAALFLAKDAVEDNQLDQAEAELRWALAGAEEVPLKQLITVRLARVLAAKGDHQAGLALIQQVPENAYKRLYLETRGDLFTQQGKLVEAKKAYDEALALEAKTSPSPYLEMKAADLAGVSIETLNVDISPEASAAKSENANLISEEGASTNPDAVKQTAITQE